MSRLSIFLTSLALTLSVAHPAAARPPLKSLPEVQEGILTLGIAYELTQVCPSLSPRMLTGYNYLMSLKDHALELGYTEDEIRSYVKDKDEKKRLIKIGRKRLRAMGAKPGDEASHCTVGQQQIASKSAIGQFMY